VVIDSPQNMGNQRVLENLEELRTFVAIVECGSLVAAARTLGVTANAVSRRLGILEGRLGRRLLHRTTRRLSVSDEGQRLYTRCRRILAEAEEAEREVMGSDGVEGVLRVAIHSDMVGSDFFRALGDALSAADKLRVQLRVAPQFLDPIHHGLDLAIHVGPPAPSSLIASRLGVLLWGLAAAPSYIEDHGCPRSPKKLVDHECLRVLRDMPEKHWRLCRDGGRPRRFAIGGRLEVDDGHALAEALNAGLGIGVRPRAEIDVGVRQGRLRHVLPAWSWASTPLYALVPPGQQRVPRVRALLDILRKTTHGLK
jgi:DNA-binding transcriptional LysR family regulator